MADETEKFFKGLEQYYRAQGDNTASDLLRLVREPTSIEKQDILKKKGLIFLPVQSKSLAQFVVENQDYFWSDGLRHVNSTSQLRDYVPPVMEVAVNPTQLALPDSFNKSRTTQFNMIEQYSKDEIEPEFPEARAIMLPSTAYAQVDKVYSEREGEALLKNFYARALDNDSMLYAVIVGRPHPDCKLRAVGWKAVWGNGIVAAVPAVVFLRK